jgi:glycosyltransferase involved in cell wall biosynthesis
MTSKISVIVPVYKTEKYLEECVNSIINQTYQNLEVILVDDGSPDNCPTICEWYAAQDSRIKVIHKENGGLSSARNAGLAMASGDWIAFVDSDDICEEQMLSELYFAAKEICAPMAVCSTFYLNGKDKQAVDEERISIRVEKSNSRQMLQRLWVSEYDNNLFTAPWNKLYNREFFGDSLRFKEGIIYEDDELFNRLYVQEYPIAVVHKPLYDWRMNPNSITHQSFAEKNCIFLSILCQRVAMFASLDMYEQARKTARVFCDIYMEYYYKAANQRHAEWVTKYSLERRNMTKFVGWRGMFKHRIRFRVFDVSPTLYKWMVLKKK